MGKYPQPLHFYSYFTLSNKCLPFPLSKKPIPPFVLRISFFLTFSRTSFHQLPGRSPKSSPAFAVLDHFHGCSHTFECLPEHHCFPLTPCSTASFHSQASQDSCPNVLSQILPLTFAFQPVQSSFCSHLSTEPTHSKVTE